MKIKPLAAATDKYRKYILPKAKPTQMSFSPEDTEHFNHIQACEASLITEMIGVQ